MSMENVLRSSLTKLAQAGEALGFRNLDPDPGVIFITGGTGVVGHRCAVKLLEAGHPNVRLGVLHPENAEDLNQLGAELASFSWDKEETYKKALTGAKTVLCTIPYTKNWFRHFVNFLNACVKAGVKHFVKISFYHARIPGDQFQEIPLVKWHGMCDDVLMEKVSSKPILHYDMDVTMEYIPGPNMSYTILYPTHFMSNPFVYQGKELCDNDRVPGTFFGASGNHGVNYVSPNDVAEVAVKVMLNPRNHYNKEYTLTGPEAIDDQRVASLLSKHLKRPIMYVDQPLHEFESEMKVSGEPSWMVKDLAAIEKIKATGTEEDDTFMTNDIEKICGHKPETFEEYLVATDTMIRAECPIPTDMEPLAVS